MQDEKNEQVNDESDPNREQEQAQVPTKQGEKTDVKKRKKEAKVSLELPLTSGSSRRFLTS